jgi:hypothetical protein
MTGTQPANEVIETKVQYGYSWMREAVGARNAANQAKASPRDELKSYLEAPLEPTDNVVAWWGVSACFMHDITC